MLVPVPFPIASLIGLGGELVAGLIPPPLTRDQVESLRTDNVVAAGSEGLAALGVQPTALEPILPTYLFRYRKGGQYAEAVARGA
jgi:NADH dehydrogenase